MTNVETWQSLLNDASQILNLKIEAYCEQLNNKENPRYFHANAYLPGDSSIKWRLKVVNPWRADYPDIQNCNSYNNCVHARLANNRSLQSIVDIPAYLNIPLNHLNSLSCSELVIGEVPGNDDLSLIVDTLVKLRVDRQNLLNELTQLASLMPRPINSYNQPIYRNDRLQFSINSLLTKGLLSVEDVDNVRITFDHNFMNPLPEDKLSFVHGDFSFGNLKIRDGKLVFIDFEHSHVGIGELDLAHLFVNLIANGQDETASILLSLYEENSNQRALLFNRAIFKALVLERVAGKMNSMTHTNGEKWERLKTLLLLKE